MTLMSDCQPSEILSVFGFILLLRDGHLNSMFFTIFIVKVVTITDLATDKFSRHSVDEKAVKEGSGHTPRQKITRTGRCWLAGGCLPRVPLARVAWPQNRSTALAT